MLEGEERPGRRGPKAVQLQHHGGHERFHRLAWLLAGFLAGLAWLLAGWFGLASSWLSGWFGLPGWFSGWFGLAGFLAGLAWLLAGLAWLLAGFWLVWLGFLFFPCFFCSPCRNAAAGHFASISRGHYFAATRLHAAF